MKSFDYTITDEIGIHARPAGILAKNLDSRINMTRLVPQLRVLHKSQPA